MAIKVRGQMLDLNEQVSLGIVVRDPSGVSTNADTIPTISIVQPNGSVMMTATAVGVINNSPGEYEYIFSVPYNGDYGVYNDVWTVILNGQRQQISGNFIVSGTNTPSYPSSDGYLHLGDYAPTNFSQTAISNLNGLIRLLKARLNSDGKSVAKDSYGNIQYMTCNMFSVDSLVSFLIESLSMFNQIPHFTTFTYDDTDFVAQFSSILVEGGALIAYASKAVIEKGAEFTISDNGVGFNPTSVGDMLKSFHDTLFTAHNEKIKLIKNSMKPLPLGSGVWSMTTSGNYPVINRMRNKREGSMF
jgi:hypothetical protein